MSLHKYLTQFSAKTVLVVGDIILDKYIQGTVSRISPEAPVQIVEVEYEKMVLGGAANVANNIHSLGAKVYLAGLVGDDKNGEELNSVLKKTKIDDSCVLVDSLRPTTTKVRVIAGRQQVVRFDYEKNEKTSVEIECELFEKIKVVLPHVDVVIISDYAKGAISAKLMKEILAITSKRSVPLLVDPRPKQSHNYGTGLTIFTPNQKEAYELVGYGLEITIEVVGRELVKRYEADILITQGSEGMTLFEKDGSISHIPTYAKEVYDIVGAGDTVIAALGLGLAAGASKKEAAQISNYAAGVVVTKAGTATVSIEELTQKIQYEESNISG